MSDLLSLQPNLDIKLYLLASDERRDKVRQEILRPTFELKTKPLSKVCGFISFSEIKKKIEGIQKLGIASSLQPNFLETWRSISRRRIQNTEKRVYADPLRAASRKAM